MQIYVRRLLSTYNNACRNASCSFQCHLSLLNKRDSNLAVFHESSMQHHLGASGLTETPDTSRITMYTALLREGHSGLCLHHMQGNSRVHDTLTGACLSPACLQREVVYLQIHDCTVWNMRKLSRTRHTAHQQSGCSMFCPLTPMKSITACSESNAFPLCSL